MRALGYIRVSTEEQASSGHSLGSQRERLQAWCVAQGLDLIDLVIDEGVSAGKPLAKRKGGAALLRRVHAGEAQVVVVVALDRLFRDTQDGLNTILGMPGVPAMPVSSITEMVDTTSPHGRFVLSVLLASAQLERDQTRARTLVISQGLRRAGRPNGSTPWGCVEQGGKLYHCPQTWPQRETLVAMAATPGADGATPSMSELAAQLRKAGIAAPQGGTTWSKNTIKRVLETHDGLKHLPAAPQPHEPPVSEAAAP